MLNNSKSLSNKRNEFFDVLKGIGILCVFYGHTAYWGTLPSRMVFSFHMPLFFLISGIFFDVGRIADFASLVKKIWRNLLLPYCFFSVVGCLIKYDLSIVEWLSEPFDQCIRLLHGEASNSIWFLVCLAMVQLLAWIVSHYFKPLLSLSSMIWGCLILTSVIIAHFVTHLLARSAINRSPLMLASVPAAMVFFATGRLFAKQLDDYGHSQTPFRNKLFFYCLSVVLFVAVALGIRRTLDLRLAVFSVKVLPTCALGLTTAFLTAKIAADFCVPCFILSAIGSRSLYLFSLELPLSYVVSKITHGKIPYPCNGTPHPYWIEPLRMAIILSMAFALSYPTQWALTYLRRYFVPSVTAT